MLNHGKKQVADYCKSINPTKLNGGLRAINNRLDDLLSSPNPTCNEECDKLLVELTKSFKPESYFF